MCQTGAIIGMGGMGIRHFEALKNANIKVVGICDVNQIKLDSYVNSDIECHTDYKSLIDSLGITLDILCIVTNTPYRYKVCEYAIKKGVKCILMEKPFTSSLEEAYSLINLSNKYGTRIGVNVYRRVSENHIKLNDFIKSSGMGEVRHISIHCASTGFGNMGSVFFDLMNFYANSDPSDVTGYIDNTGTPSLRGPEFIDPGGYGLVNYKNGVRGIIDISEDTGVPYTFHIVTTYGRIFIEEAQDKWNIYCRNKEGLFAPLTQYYRELYEIPFDLSHNWDVVYLTAEAIRQLISDKEITFNVSNATTVMEMITGFHASNNQGHVPVRLPLDKSFHKMKFSFA